MGEKRIELLQCEEPISPDQMLDMQDNANQHVNNLVDDVIGEGVVAATLAPTGTGVGVSISNFECWSASGHGKQTAAVAVSLLSHIPVTGSKWVSVFATPGFESGDLRANAYGTNEYHKRTEAVTFSVLAGTSGMLPANPGGGAVRVCSIRLSAGMTALLLGQIKSSGSYSDTPLSAKVNKTGDTLTGTLTYNGRPLSRMNNGGFKIPGPPALITNTGYPDFDNHYALAYGPINTGIVSENLVVLIVPTIEFIKNVGGVIEITPVRVQPITMRMHTDLFAGGDVSQSEGIFVIYEEDIDGKNTGRFWVFLLGTEHYCNRFAGRTLRWTAIAPQPVLTLEG